MYLQPVSNECIKKAILVDPIQGNDTGEPCYYVESNDFKGWINTKDFLTLKKKILSQRFTG